MSEASSRSFGRHRRFTPEVLAAVPEWRRLGASPEEIAAVLDTTVSSLQVSCSRVGISLRASYRLPTLSPSQWVKLCQEAEDRGVPPTRLVTRILAAVVDEKLFSAVLGDYDDLTESPQI